MSQVHGLKPVGAFGLGEVDPVCGSPGSAGWVVTIHASSHELGRRVMANALMRLATAERRAVVYCAAASPTATARDLVRVVPNQEAWTTFRRHVGFQDRAPIGTDDDRVLLRRLGEASVLLVDELSAFGPSQVVEPDRRAAIRRLRSLGRASGTIVIAFESTRPVTESIDEDVRLEAFELGHSVVARRMPNRSATPVELSLLPMRGWTPVARQSRFPERLLPFGAHFRSSEPPGDMRVSRT